MYNYADDNTLSYSNTDIDKLVHVLENDSRILIKWFSDNQMQANPDKFQAIALGKKTHDANISFNLNDNVIKCDDEVKLLGVTFDFMLNFKSHVLNICKKASRQLNVLKRIGTHLNRLGKLTIYYSFILSNFNYCPLVWHFCGENNSKKIEHIQERALRFIYDDDVSNYEQLLEMSKLPSLKIRRLRLMGIQTFKMLNKNSPVYLHDLINKKNNMYSFRYRNTAEVPRVRTTKYGLHSLRYAATKLWNDLPNEYREDMSLDHFKNLMNKWGGEVCKCNFCK